MKIEELNGDQTWEGECHDCGKHVEVSVILNEENKIEVSGGAVYRVKQQYTDEELFFKCDDCFNKDKTLRDYKKTLVYSRVVGYLRPVSGWNKGKKEEFKKRKEFKTTEGK